MDRGGARGRARPGEQDLLVGPARRHNELSSELARFEPSQVDRLKLGDQPVASHESQQRGGCQALDPGPNQRSLPTSAKGKEREGLQQTSNGEEPVSITVKATLQVGWGGFGLRQPW